MLDPVSYLKCRREHLMELMRTSHNAEETMHISLKLENIEYELQRA